ncbi:3'(2'),5'-bisphosphate nucleotidase CysQ [Flavilitoribacter nigricans]|uniref:3'(2'),5'-bisphosphate nucleotidase CysQ n=1 Tax=Flavilitoribacter nigricans (strain ATCC 23147 / DSM 23189 / NBRC 102662 / NCIMB 1420 / SS-2) TaxID=1122177 RepID=A0A2D0N3S9_FLAN2|nr:3'(2'),5'-bisphosphate nucleotidase CysQ [Flavilitoribacter nigricans]PHN03165.1 3'(2'),5'-bisphosphate nucleotidase [Flavilitoribacter nigricans DSM 23189 = NBRC 102662]
MINWKDLAENVIEIAEAAGAAILDIYRNEADFNVEMKSDDSPLTKADRAANAVICEGLENLSQVFPIVSEENKAIPYEERKDFAYYWLVDPLDGTKEFIKRNGEFTVNIALVYEQQPVFGVVYAPVLEEMYWAIKGQGAWMRKGTTQQTLRANTFSMSDEGLKVVCSRSHLNEGTQAFIDALNQPEKVSQGSSLKFLLMAKGAAHVYPRLGPTMEWDTGAAQIVLEEAGGKVIDEETKAPLRYNKENLLNPYFIAYGNITD